MKRKTVVHVMDLLGCVFMGPTTDDAIAIAPDAIRQYLRFLKSIGEPVDPKAPFDAPLAEHVIHRGFLGGAQFDTDLRPVSAKEIETYIARFQAMREILASWAESASKKDLAAVGTDGNGRASEKILLHILTVPGAYLGAALGGSKGFSAIGGAVERGQMPLPDALRKVEAMAIDVMRNTTKEQRSAVVHRANGDVRTLRRAIRSTLEHDWEHLTELSRRPTGPRLPKTEARVKRKDRSSDLSADYERPPIPVGSTYLR